MTNELHDPKLHQSKFETWVEFGYKKEFMNWDHNYYGKMSLLEYLEKYKPQIINLWYKYMESKNG